ncbi:hypothetical protein BsWGS_04049 [Bradybaena similaris]
MRLTATDNSDSSAPTWDRRLCNDQCYKRRRLESQPSVRPVFVTADDGAPLYTEDMRLFLLCLLVCLVAMVAAQGIDPMFLMMALGGGGFMDSSMMPLFFLMNQQRRQSEGQSGSFGSGGLF